MKQIKKLMLALALSVAALPSFAQFATPTQFIPVPMSEKEPVAVFVNLNSAQMFSAALGVGQEKGGRSDLYNMQLNLGLVYNVGMGFDVGFGVHGGLTSPFGMFRSEASATQMMVANGITRANQYGFMFGADVMVRYMAMLSDMFFGGLQYQVGYDYTTVMRGVPDSYATEKGYSSVGAMNSFIPMNLGLSLGAYFGDFMTAYLFPAIEFGQTPTSGKTADTGIWKSAIGMQINAGVGFKTGIGDINVQVSPRMADFNNKNSWGMNYNLGMAWNF